MSKKQTAAVAKEANPQLVERVKAIIADADDRHTYSVSKVYGAYNEALGKTDKPETCASCLKLRVEALKKWLKDLPKAAKTPEDTAKAGTPAPEVKDTGKAEDVVVMQYDDPAGDNFVAPGEGVTRHPMAEGLPLDFLPGTEDVNKGTIKYADGSKVPAGTVATNAGTTFVIQANGKARIETEDLT